MSSLRRVKAGDDFSLENAYTLEQVQRAADSGETETLLLPLDSLFFCYPSLTVSQRGEKSIKNGGGASAPGAADGLYRVYSGAGEFLALGDAQNGAIKIVKSFFEV